MSSRLDLMAGQFKENKQQIVVAHLKYLTYNLNPIDLGHHCPDIFITFIFAHLILRVIIAFITDYNIACVVISNLVNCHHFAKPNMH